MDDTHSSPAVIRNKTLFSVNGEKASWIGAAVLLSILFLQCLYAARTTGQTVDETYYNGSGYPMVRYNNYGFLGEHPPFIIQLGALPLLLLQPHFPIQSYVRLPGSTSVDISKTGALFLYKMGNDPQLILFLERLPIVGLTILLGFGIFLFAKDLYGKWGSLLALCLYSFSPDVIANGSLYTTDMGLAVFYFFAIYALKLFFDSPSDRRALWVGLAFGAALMSKISGLILLPVISSLFLGYYFSVAKQVRIQGPSLAFEKWVLGIAIFLIANAIGEKQAMVLFGPLCILAVYLCARDIEKIRNSRILRIGLKVAALGGAVLCLVYSVRLKKKYGVSFASFLLAGNLVALGMAVLLARISTEDTRMRILKFFLAIWVFAAFVIVLGYTDLAYKLHRFIGFGNYMKPLGIVINHSRDGHGSCVEGSFIACDWRYFPGVMAVKTPLLTLLLSGGGALVFLISRRPLLIKALIFVPVAFFLGAAMTNKINIGLRHILPIYPFLFVLGGLPGAAIANMKPGLLKKTLAVILLVLLVLTAGRTLQSAPDYLTYFNEFVKGPEQGVGLVGGSNLNWGQNNKLLAEFVLERKIPSITIAAEAENADIYDYYKLRWRRPEANELINPAPGFYALSTGYCIVQQNDPKSWFYGKQPNDRVGKTFYVFEVPQKQPIDDRP